MSEVKRYDMRVSLGGVESYESSCGDYVDYEDYAALEAKCAALAAELKQIRIDADCYKKGMEASNARLVQLAAENAALKSGAMDEIKHMQDQAIDDGCRIAELEEALRDKQALIPDECDTTAQQFESLAKS